MPLGPYFFYYYDEYKWIECCMDRCRRSVPGLPLFPYYSAPSYTKGQLVDWGRKFVRYGLAICQLSVTSPSAVDEILNGSIDVPQ